MAIHLTPDEERALIKLLTLIHDPQKQGNSVGDILEELLEKDRLRLWRLETVLEQKLGKAQLLKS